jgi:hypothetical protein
VFPWFGVDLWTDEIGLGNWSFATLFNSSIICSLNSCCMVSITGGDVSLISSPAHQPSHPCCSLFAEVSRHVLHRTLSVCGLALLNPRVGHFHLLRELGLGRVLKVRRSRVNSASSPLRLYVFLMGQSNSWRQYPASGSPFHFASTRLFKPSSVFVIGNLSERTPRHEAMPLALTYRKWWNCIHGGTNAPLTLQI